MHESDQGHDHDDFERDLERAANGGAQDRNRVWQKYYPMFKECAEEWFRNKWDGNAVSIGATHIAGELFLRMGDRAAAMDKGRTFFFKCFYTECMRVVVDHWRAANRRRKRSQELGQDSITLDDRGREADPEQVVELLEELKRHDESVGMVAMVKVLESRSDEQGGRRKLTNQEVAEMLDMGLRTVEKRWAFAKAWLSSRLAGDDATG